MRNQLNILFISVILIISTTGLPFTYHLCQMMQSKTLNECQICAINEANTSSCCDAETTVNEVTLTLENPVCCQTEFVYNKIKDQFINSKNETNLYPSIQKLFESVSQIQSQFEFVVDESFYSDSSPPFLIDTQRYLTNSILLI